MFGPWTVGGLIPFPSGTAVADRGAHGIETYSRRSSEKQREFHRLCDLFPEVHFVAGRQSGKTESGSAQMVKKTVLEPVANCTDWLIASDTYDRVLAARFRFQEMLPWGCWSWRASEKRYVVQGRDGAVANVWIRNGDADACRSLTLDGAWVDEEGFCPKEFFDNLLPTLATRDGRWWGTGTPVGRNHVFQMYSPPTEGVGVVFAESRDNPAFSEEQWQKAIKRYGYDSPFFQQEHRGIAAAYVGQAVPKFAKGIIGPAKWSQDWTTVVGMDFGWTAGTAALLCQVSPEDDVVIWGLKYWTETERHMITADLNWPWCDHSVPVYAIDPSGSSGRAPEAGDIGWQEELEDMERLRNGSSLIDVRWNRLIGESASLNMIRILAERGKVRVAENAIAQVMGGKDEGAYEIETLLQGAKLSKNLEKDELDDSHPEAEVMDSLRYVVVNLMPHLQARVPVVSRHG